MQDAKLAAVNEQRYANLLKTGDTSRLTYDQQRTNTETTNAKAALKTYENTKNVAAQNYQGHCFGAARLANAQTQVNIAQKAITDAVVYAPISGSVDERQVSAGEYVTSSSKIATIVRTSPIKLSLPLPEVEAGKVTIGMGMSASVQNTTEVAELVKQRLAEIQPTLPEDFKTQIIGDQSVFIEASLESIQTHLIERGLLASLVVFLFLWNFRSTIIAAIPIPVSLISTFAIMAAVGYTLNQITMLSLTSMVGIVINDAIVVLENI